jgi:hypothetical protein
VAVLQNRWQVLGLAARGEQFEVTLGNRVLFTATDRTFTAEGRVGLWTKADSLTHFDDLQVEALM